jgi:hypothetical protein
MISQIIQKMNEGGAVFTYPILATSIVITIYFVKALRNKLRTNGLAKLIASYGWFVFAWGSLGSAAGVIAAFDSVKNKIFSELTLNMAHDGLRMVMITSLLTAFVFSLSRIYIVILNTIENKKN